MMVMIVRMMKLVIGCDCVGCGEEEDGDDGDHKKSNCDH